VLSEIQVLKGPDADRLIADSQFRAEWHDLHRQCPWATVFQDPRYVWRWYEVYSQRYEPVVVVGRDSADKLHGLLCLGSEQRSGNLVPAGVPQTYSVWLARPETHDQYVEGALDQVAKRFPGAQVLFDFLPAGTPLSWLGPGRRWRPSCELRSFSCPIAAVCDGEKFRESIQKKSNKKLFKQLERQGRLEFEQVFRFEQIGDDFSEMLDLYDFRQGALYRATPFRDEPRKGAFLRSLYEVPGLLHTTVWRLDGRVISAHIGFHQEGRVTLGYRPHSPSLAKCSPARLHLYLLGSLFAEQGISELDLTAGGDAYKERFATHHDEVYRLTVFFSRRERLRVATVAAARSAAKRALGLISVTPEDVREQVGRVRALGRRALRAVRGGGSAGQRGGDPVAYHLARAHAVGSPSDQPAFRRNAVGDLLAYEPHDAQGPTRFQFLGHALTRLERGDQVYTCAENGLLIAHVWLSRPSVSAPQDRADPVAEFPTGAILVDGFTVHPRHRDRGLFRAAVARILWDLVSTSDSSAIFVAVDSADVSARQALSGLGFDDRSRLGAGTTQAVVKDLEAVDSASLRELHDNLTT
jgi:CelD/BcsL family acetyltransferase involved in cellulose biosynthesis